MTRADYFKYRLGIRDGLFNTLIYAGKLFQQWIVDRYVKIERDRIEYCRNEQSKLRVETYQGLPDYLEKTANRNNAQVGKIIILPSTFSGSPRNMM